MRGYKGRLLVCVFMNIVGWVVDSCVKEHSTKAPNWLFHTIHSRRLYWGSSQDISSPGHTRRVAQDCKRDVYLLVFCVNACWERRGFCRHFEDSGLRYCVGVFTCWGSSALGCLVTTQRETEKGTLWGNIPNICYITIWQHWFLLGRANKPHVSI